MIKAIIFDADNTLYSTLKVAEKVDILVMKKISPNKPRKTYKNFKKIVERLKKSKDPKKRSRTYSYSILLSEYEIPKKRAKLLYKIFFKEMLKEIKLTPGIKTILPKLSKKYNLCIVSEDYKKELLSKLKRLSIKKYFSIIISSDDAKIMKPSMKYYQIALKKLKMMPEEILVVGDSFENDLSIPKKLGMKTVLFLKKDKRADYRIRNIKDLHKLLNKIC